MNLKILGLLLALVTGVLPLTAQTTYRSIPMDCGGWFSGFAVHSSGRLYGFGDVFGMWRSDDAGQSWKYLQGDFTSSDTFINGCAVATGNADTVAFLSDSKVFKSTDGGSTWTNPLSSLSPRRDRGATPLIFQPGDDNELWLASGRNGFTGTLWNSTDGGTTWNKAGGSTFDSTAATTIYVRPEFPDQIWVGAAGGLYISTDHGISWTQVWNNAGGIDPFANPTPTVTAIARRADGVGYIATNTKGWRITATDFTNPATYTATATVSWWSGWGPTNATVLADGSFLTNTASDNLSRSTDGGLTWTNLGMQLLTPPTPAWTTAASPTTKADGGRDMIVQDPTNAARWFMTGGKAPVITTDSGATWKYPPIGNGIAGVPSFKVRFPRGNTTMALIPVADQGGFTVTDGGFSGNVANCIRSSIDIHQTYHEILSSDDGQTQIAAGVNQADNATIITKSTNGGNSWAKLDLTAAGLPASYEGITRAIAAPGNINDFLVLLGATEDPAQIAAGRNNPGLYRTINGGVSFTKVTGIPDGVNTGMRYHQENSWLETDGVNTNTRYLSLRSNPDTTPSARGFWRSTDGGSTWAKTPGQPVGSDWILCMAVDRATAGRVWVAGGYRGILRSDDGGNSWVSVSGFTDTTSIDAANGCIAVWGMRSGDTWFKLYYSADNGVTWTEKTGPGQRYANLSALAVDPNRAGQIWVSGISVNVINPPAAITVPVLNLTPDPMTYSMAPGTTANVPLTLTNTGTAALTWSVTNSAIGTYTTADSSSGGPAYAWLDGVTGGTSLGASSSTYTAVTLPFSMPYYGSNYTSLSISPKGWLSLGPDQVGTSYSSNQALPATVPTFAPPNLIAGLWDNINITGGSAGVFYKQTDASTFVVTYRDVQSGTNSDRRATFQIILKADGRIIFQYQSCTFTNNSYCIGIQNSDASQSLAITNNTAYLANTTRAITLSPPSTAWLTAITPASHTAAGGSLAPDSSQLVSVAVNSTGLTPGQIYSTNLVFASNDPNAATRILPFSLSVVPAAPTGLTTFRSATGLAADGAQDLLTPAGDGVASLLKYAFNMIGSDTGQASSLATPNSSVLAAAGSAGLPFASIEPVSEKLRLTYIRRKASGLPAPGITYAVEFSNDVGKSDPWAANASATESTISIDSTFERVTITDSAVSSRRFVRVRVSAF